MAEAANIPEPNAVFRQIVHIVEDDEQFRLSLLDLFQSLNMDAQGFEGPSDFFDTASKTNAGCLLLDVRLPGINGIEFQKELEMRGYDLPVVFMTAHGDVAMSVNAMKAGAVDFLEKPLQTAELIDAIKAAFTLDVGQQQERAHRMEIRRRAASLTRRETQVLGFVARGLMNKQIAFELGISEIMVKLHRGSMMRKMEATSLADLVRQFEQLS
ncbi:response regulator transcription factor [Pararhizobium sp.]|uniref:response regulator transcription factor n=1 Tax=Pararhizobium sp. TaxID=1977563 RepID=UPI003D13259A